jgi:hypothetical protein
VHGAFLSISQSDPISQSTNAPKKPQEHTVADFDTSSLLYLVPLTLHALAALAFFTRSVHPSVTAMHPTKPLVQHTHLIHYNRNSKPHPTLPVLWRPAIRLRVFSYICLALAVPTLVARVVTLHQYCRLEGRVAEKEEQAPMVAGNGNEDSSSSSELFKVYRYLSLFTVHINIDPKH